MDIKKIADEIIAKHPYKVEGRRETYSHFNAGWERACDAFEQRLSEELKAKGNGFSIVSISDPTKVFTGHWSDGLSVTITKDGVEIKLEGEELSQLIKLLPRTFGGSLR